MTPEEMTPEEAEAFKAMEQGEAVEVESVPEKAEAAEEPETKAEAQADAEEATEAEGEGKEAEFKSSRAEQKPPEGYVPHQAMHAERMRRQELEKKLEALEAQIAPKEETPQYVDPLEDPEGHKKYDEWSKQQIAGRVDEFIAKQEQAAQQQQRFAEASRLEAEFAAKTTDYQDAAAFLHQARVTELRNQGLGDNEIQAQIASDANALFDAARQIGMNPAELLYIRAGRAGYAKAEAQAESTAETEAEKITRLADAQQKTRGVGTAGGSKQSGRLTAEQLGMMSDAEFDKTMQERPDEVRRAMGG